MISTLLVKNAASLWYPIMMAQMAHEISESKAAELLGIGVPRYQEERQNAIEAVMEMIHKLPSPLISLLGIMKDRPDLLTPND